jgi:cyclohexa-1,5-dienecarbonyl-CoA hydratase
MSAAHATLNIAPPVAWLKLAHSRQNVIDFQMMEELALFLRDLESRKDVSVLAVSGEGEHFSAGVDIPSHTPDRVEAMLAKFHAVIRALVTARPVTIAVVRGNCLGGGAELAMVCDMAITTDGAHWGFPEIKLACYPPVACAALAAIVGQKRAAELVLTGRTFVGTEAVQYGLANYAVPQGELNAKAEELIASLTSLSPAAVAVAKRALYAWDAAHFDKGLARAERLYKDELRATRDMAEGIQAWMERRVPKWSGE